MGARQRADLGHERPLTDDVDADVAALGDHPAHNLDHQQRVLLLGQTPGEEDSEGAGVPVDQAGVNSRGVELSGRVDAGGDHSDCCRLTSYASMALGQMLAGHREGIDEVSVASRHIAHVAASVGLLHVKLDDHRRRSLEAPEVREQLESRGASS